MAQQSPAPFKIRPVFLLAGLFSLLTGLYAGLLRLDLPLPGQIAAYHGPLMVSGFLGTLIGLERAAHHGGRWPLAVPVSAFGGALCLLGGQGAWALGLWLFSVCLHFVVFLRAHWPLKWPVDGLSLSGLLAWLSALIFWLMGHSPRAVAVAMMVFPVLTILSERWPTAPVGEPRLVWSDRLGTALALALGLSTWAGFVFPAVGVSSGDLPLRLGGFLLASAGLFLLIAEEQKKSPATDPGWERYLKTAMRLSYGWLSLSGFWLLGLGEQSLLDPFYDPLIHGLGVGFILGVIFSHFYKVLKALLGLELPFNGRFYLPLGLLQAGLALRLLGKMGGSPVFWQIGGSLNVLAILMFMATVGLSLWVGRRKKRG